jgi:hypothetical protein
MLCRCPQQVTDCGVNIICSFTGLTHLDLGGCGDITDNCIASLSSLPSLTDLSVNYCFGVTKHAIDDLKRMRPNLRITRNV